MLSPLLCLPCAWLLLPVLGRKRLSRRPSFSVGRATRVTLSTSSLHLQTTAFNSWPAAILAQIPTVKLGSSRRGLTDTDEGGWRRSSRQRRLAGWFDAGAAIGGVLALLVAQAILLIAAKRAIGAAAAGWLGATPSLTVSAGADRVRRRLARRAPVPPSDRTPAVGSLQDGLLLRPLLPDLTGAATLGTIVTTLFALGVSQVWHEAGHALAAAAEQIPLLSCGFKLYFLILPAFYVGLPTSTPDALPLQSSTRLRIASAGVWHNIVLALAVWVLAGGSAREAGIEAGLGMNRKVGEALGVWETLDEGVVVTAVSTGSALAQHLPPGTRITHLDDQELELDSLRVAGSKLSTIDLWQQALVSTRTAGDYTSLGWCLDEAHFPRGPATDCCGRPGVENEISGLCFEVTLAAPSSSREKAQACLDPLALDLDSDRVARCVDAASCGASPDGAESVCARVSREMDVVRVGVAESEAADEGAGSRRRRQTGRTVWWQGPKSGVLHQVAVTDVVPRFEIVPLSLFGWLESFYSSIWSISLGLAFFNSLPLPHLDGIHILAASFDCLAAVQSVLPADSFALDVSDPAPLWILSGLGRSRFGRVMVRHRNKVERLLRRWTAYVGSLTVIATLIVEVRSVL